MIKRHSSTEYYMLLFAAITSAICSELDKIEQFLGIILAHLYVT